MRHPDQRLRSREVPPEGCLVSLDSRHDLPAPLGSCPSSQMPVLRRDRRVPAPFTKTKSIGLSDHQGQPPQQCCTLCVVDDLEPLTDAERKLLEAVQISGLYDLSQDDDTDRTVRAAVLKAILSGEGEASGIGAGAAINLRGAVVSGDLAGFGGSRLPPIRLESCRFEDSVDFSGATFTGTADPPPPSSPRRPSPATPSSTTRPSGVSGPTGAKTTRVAQVRRFGPAEPQLRLKENAQTDKLLDVHKC